MSPLPFPVRIAAGLAVTAVEQVRELPRHAVELPVTAVSQALQVSMRLQQKVTELAIKGDRALGALRPPEEVPRWAVFDDDLAEADLDLPDPEPIAPPLPDVEPRNGTVSTLRHRSRTGIPIARPAAESNRGAVAAAAPYAVPDYPQLSVPQLRGKLRMLSVHDLSDLLAWETSHDNRPAYVTMLTNRIATLSQET